MSMYICISRCLMAEFRAPLVQSPYLLVAGQYDSALLKKNLGKHNLLPIPVPWRGFWEPSAYGVWQLQYAKMLRERTRRVLAQVAEAAPAAIFSTACYGHCLSDNDAVFQRQVSTATQRVALNAFVAAWIRDGHKANMAPAVEDCAGFDCGCVR